MTSPKADAVLTKEQAREVLEAGGEVRTDRDSVPLHYRIINGELQCMTPKWPDDSWDKSGHTLAALVEDRGPFTLVTPPPAVEKVEGEALPDGWSWSSYEGMFIHDPTDARCFKSSDTNLETWLYLAPGSRLWSTRGDRDSTMRAALVEEKPVSLDAMLVTSHGSEEIKREAAIRDAINKAFETGECVLDTPDGRIRFSTQKRALGDDEPAHPDSLRAQWAKAKAAIAERDELLATIATLRSQLDEYRNELESAQHGATTSDQLWREAYEENKGLREQVAAKEARVGELEQRLVAIGLLTRWGSA